MAGKQLDTPSLWAPPENPTHLGWSSLLLSQLCLNLLPNFSSPALSPNALIYCPDLLTPRTRTQVTGSWWATDPINDWQ